MNPLEKIGFSARESVPAPANGPAFALAMGLAMRSISWL
jgi:hypothetical protein